MTQQDDLLTFTYNASWAAWPFFMISTIVFGMRTVIRVFSSKKVPLWWDDFFICISCLDIVRIVAFQLALNATRRIDMNDSASYPSTVPAATFWTLLTDSWSFLRITLPKMSVALLLIRIFQPRPWLKQTMMWMAIGLNIVCFGGFLICFVQCSPVAGQWDAFRYPKTKCWPRDIQVYYALVGSSFSAFLDFSFAVYPGFVIWNLQMPMWKKLSTMTLMSLGLCAFGAAIVKVASVASYASPPGNTDLMKVLNNALHTGLWNSIENDLIITAACLPTVPPIFVALTRRFRTTVTRSAFSTLRSPKNTSKAPIDEHDLEIMRNGKPTGWNDQDIHVQYAFSLERESAKWETQKQKASYESVAY